MQKYAKAAMYHLTAWVKRLTTWLKNFKARREIGLTKTQVWQRSMYYLKRALELSEQPRAFLWLAAAGGIFLIAAHSMEGGSPSHDRPDPTISADNNPPQKAEDTGSGTISEQRAAAEQTSEKPEVRTWVLKKRETLSDLLRRAGLEVSQSYALANRLGSVANLRNLKPGQAVEIRTNSAAPGAVQELRLRDRFASLAVIRAAGENSDSFEAVREPIATVPLTHLATGTIENSLYVDARSAGVPDNIVVEFIGLLGYSVDFQREIRRGDSFEIYFTRTYAPEYSDIEDGQILFGRLIRGDRVIDAVFFEESDGHKNYFNQDGENIKKALMRTPINGARLSGRFGKRKHPILGYTRLHKGLDFAAPRGTPIMAAGDGTIEVAGRNGSFGNYIRIKHPGGLSTAYAHMKSFARGIKKGRRVNQGQIIGYVGSTGRSTGPHLHYEILKGSRQVNPLTVKMPKGRPIQEADRNAFERNLLQLRAEMESVAELQAQMASLHTGKDKQLGR